MAMNAAVALRLKSSPSRAGLRAWHPALVMKSGALHRTLFAIGLIVGLANTVGCRSTPAPWPYEGVYSGYYSRGFELSFFQPQGSSERWWLSGYEKVEPTLAPQNSEIYLVVRGSITPKGSYGHLGAYDRELRVSQLIEFRGVAGRPQRF